MKVRLLRQLSAASRVKPPSGLQGPPQAHQFISLLLEEYGALCQAARTISSFLGTLVRRHVCGGPQSVKLSPARAKGGARGLLPLLGRGAGAAPLFPVPRDLAAAQKQEHRVGTLEPRGQRGHSVRGRKRFAMTGVCLRGARVLCCVHGGRAGVGQGVGAAQRWTEEGFVLRRDASPRGRLPVLVKGTRRPALPGPLTASERPWPWGAAGGGGGGAPPGTWPRRPRRTCWLEGETGRLCFLGLLTVCGGGPHRSHFVIK